MTKSLIAVTPGRSGPSCLEAADTCQVGQDPQFSVAADQARCHGSLRRGGYRAPAFRATAAFSSDLALSAQIAAPMRVNAARAACSTSRAWAYR